MLRYLVKIIDIDSGVTVAERHFEKLSDAILWRGDQNGIVLDLLQPIKGASAGQFKRVS